jgi:glycosyltransferase involved in cell wall biosynthesis
MRILNICAYTWEVGGPARVIYDHTLIAIKHGHQVDILSAVAPNSKAYPVPDGANLIVCKLTPIISRFFPDFSIGAYRYLQKHIDEYDIVQCHGLFHFGAIAPFLFKTTATNVFTIHGVLDKWALKGGYLKKKIFSFIIQKQCLKNASLIHVFNQDEFNDLKNYLGFQHPNVVIIPNGMALSELTNLPPKDTFRTLFDVPNDKKIVLFMGRLNVKKGLDLLLPAFKKYTTQYQDSILIIAGTDDGYEATTKQFITDNQLDTQIKLVGMITGDVKKAALAAATIFVLPSYSEGFSIAALESMAAGVPALVSKRIGFDGTVARHEAAHEVELTMQSVFEGIEKMLQNPDYCMALKTNAQQMVCELFDIEKVAVRLLESFKEIKSQN